MQPPPLQPFIKSNHTTTKTIKRDKHPMIKLQQQLQHHHTTCIKNKNKNNNDNSDKTCIQPQHPQVVNDDTSTVSLPTEFDQFSNESDNISCSELTYDNMNVSDHINKIESSSIINESELIQTEKEKPIETEKYKAFVVMNGKTKSIESENKTETVVIENKNVSDEHQNVETRAIVVGECDNKMVPLSSDKEKGQEPVIDNVINEASNVCLDGINDEDNFKMIGDNVIRTNKIESLIKKMESYQTNNSNPVTNKFSTYWQRNESIGGTLLESEQIANKYIDKDVVVDDGDDDDDDDDDDDNIMTPLIEYDDDDDCDDIVNNNDNSTTATTTTTRTRTSCRTRTRSRREQQNYKKAKKYCAPSDELTRLQIREDIRKMRNPKVNEIKLILKAIGLNQFINHKAYIDLYGNDNRSNNNNHNNHNDVQFIGINATKHKKKKKKKRKHRNYDYNYNDYDYNEYDYYGYQNQVFSISNETNINETQSQSQSQSQSQPQPQSQSQPHKKRQKLNANMSHEPIKCNQCNKIFTLEVDLLLHKTNDKCSN